MKNAFLFIAAVSWLISACTQNANLRITISNPSDYDRTEELVAIPINALQNKITLEKGQTYIVKNNNGETVASQLTYDGKLVFQTGTKSKETRTYTIYAGVEQTYEAKTYGRFVTERKDDFAWENDRVAFRIYGPALIQVDGPSNGLDLWYKRTHNLVVDKWYNDDIAGIRSYHIDHGEGCDDYKVGRSLGAGMMAPYSGKKLWLNDNFVKPELLENGPLRTTFILMYRDVDMEGRTFSESRLFSIDAGSQLTKVTQQYGTDEAMPVAAGIVKRAGEDSLLKNTTKNGTTTLIYAEPTSKTSGNVYVGMVFPGKLNETAVDTYTIAHALKGTEETYSHILGITTYQPGSPIVYYTGYGWSKFGFPTADDFAKYVEQFALNLENPLIIKY